MASFLVLMLLVFGLNTMVWATVGCLRVIAGRMRRARSRREQARGDRPSFVRTGGAPAVGVPRREQVAVLMAAHDEELVIADSLRDLAASGAGVRIFVVSDGSHDRTADIARDLGASVLELNPNRGKAGALAEAIRHFRIADDFEVLVLVDADTHLAADYFDTGLPEFADPGVVAVAGRATTLLTPRCPTLSGRILLAYRERVYIAMQYLFKFGQAARHANVVPIVPGFASMYRTRILSEIDIDAPGLVIEDYNMTFEVHAKRLGRIAFHPHVAVARTQDPDRLPDYVKQVERWNTGFWQTVLRHRFRPGRLFWLSLGLFVLELLVSSAVLVLVLPAVVLSVLGSQVAALGWDPAGTAGMLTGAVPPLALVLGVVIPDYLLTVLAVVVTRDARYFAYGLVFPLFRVIDAVLCLVALFKAVFLRTGGTWTSPSRRLMSVEADAGAGAVAVAVESFSAEQ